MLLDKKTQNIIKEALGESYKDKIYICGGAVRDYIRNEKSNDIDILCLCDLEEIFQLFKAHNILEKTGEYNNLVGTKIAKINGLKIEFSQGHNEANDLFTDAINRDFTVNSLFYNLWSEEIIDPLNKGISHIKEGIIDTSSNPEDTIEYDPSRMLRAIRFAVKFNYSISKKLKESITQNAFKINRIPTEKIESELTKIILSNKPVKGIRLLKEFNLLKEILPELDACVNCMQNNYHYLDVFEHSLKVLGGIENNEDKHYLKILRYAALFHDLGKPSVKTTDENGIIHFYNHSEISEQITRNILNRLKMSNNDIKDISYLVLHHMDFSDYDKSWQNVKIRKAIQKITPKYIKMFCELREADILALAPKYRTLIIQHKDFVKRINDQEDIINGIPNILKGNEIIKLCHLKNSSKIIGEIIKYLQDMIINEKLKPNDTAKAKVLAYEKYKTYIISPLDGNEIINILKIKPGKEIGEIISYLKDLVINNELSKDDKETAKQIILHKFSNK